MRYYSMFAMRPGGIMAGSERELQGRCRVRVVAVLMFRRVFGHEPTESWGLDGVTAWAGDRRGNWIHVDQQNRDMTPVALLPQFAASLQGGAQ
jgi:hypothetical protein